jgi:hypothetical protein
MSETTNGGRIVVPSTTMPPAAHKHNVTDLVGLDTGTIPNGAVPTYNGTTWTPTIPAPNRPTSTPGAPTFASTPTTGQSILPGVSTAATYITCTLTPPTTNTDSTTFSGAQSYAVRWRYENQANKPWTVVTSLAAVSNASDTGSTGGNVITFYGVKPGETISIEASVTDVYGNVSPWSYPATSVTAYKDGTPPNAPSTPVCTSYLSGIQVKWDGLDFAGAAQPVDFSYVDVHVGTSSTFTPSSATQVDRLLSAGQTFFMKDGSGTALTLGNTYYVRLIAYDYAGNASSVSTAGSAVVSFSVNTASGTGTLGANMVGFNARQIGGITTTISSTAPSSPVAGDIWLDTSSGTGVTQKQYTGSAWTVIQLNAGSIAANTITATQIAAAAITAGSAIIDTAAISSAQIASIDAGKISTGSLTATVGITTGKLFVGSSSTSGARITMDSTGIKTYNATASTPTFSLNSSTGAFAISSSGLSTGARVELDGSGLRAYDANGQTIDINANGNASFKGTINASTLAGMITTAAGATGNTQRAELDTAGLRIYNGTEKTVDIGPSSAYFKGTITAGTGSTISGDYISGGTISGVTITGGTVQTAASGGRVVLTGGTKSNQVSLLTGDGSETGSGFVSSTALSLSTWKNLWTTIGSPSVSSGSAASISLYGTGTGTGSNATNPYGREAHIELNPFAPTTDKVINVGWWPRVSGSGGAASLSFGTGTPAYLGFMDADGYYILMQSIAAQGVDAARSTYLSSSPGGTTYIKSNGNDGTGRIEVSSGNLAFVGATSLTGSLTLTGKINASGSLYLKPSSTVSGVIVNSSNDFVPETTSTSNLGTTAARWLAIVGTTLNLAGSITGASSVSAGASSATIVASNNGSTANAITVNNTTVSYNTTSAAWHPDTDNTYFLGSVSGPALRWKQICAATSTIATSDMRDKTDIETISPDGSFGMSFIRALNPVSYKFSNAGNEFVFDNKGNFVLDADGRRTIQPQTGLRPHTGFIAQQVKQAMDISGVSDWGGWVLGNKDDLQSEQALRYEEFISPIVSAIQNIDARLTALETK